MGFIINGYNSILCKFIYIYFLLINFIILKQKCCGGISSIDYLNSFWYLNNNERGTRSFVPRSCCKQSQNSRAWSIVPIDSMCTTYNYYTKAFNDSVNVQVYFFLNNLIKHKISSFFFF